VTETAKTLRLLAHDIYRVWIHDGQRHFGDHAAAQIVSDLLHALAVEEYDDASTLLVCLEAFFSSHESQQ
jgi:hypothetical protein